MRRLIQILAVTLTLLGGSLVLGGSATAQPPAEPYKFDTCTNVINGFCQYGRVVVQRQSQAPATYHATSYTCSRVLSNSQVTFETCYQNNYFFNDHVGHLTSNVNYTFEQGGITYNCTDTTRYTVAGGQLRHYDSNSKCDPPVLVA